MVRFPSKFKQLQPLDRVSLLVMLGLTVLIVLLLGSGDHTVPKVREFSWQDQAVGAEDVAFILSFNRAMDWESVRANLRLEPPLTGKVSWSGRRLAYTLTEPLPYGQKFQLHLAGAQQATQAQAEERPRLQPFVGQFHSRDRAIAYLGVNGEEADRLILYNLTQQQKTILTPPELVVSEFKFYPQGDRILFAASDRQIQAQGGFDPQLYSVTTGLEATSNPAEPKVEQILDNQQYQILKFDLAGDGQKLVLQLADRQQLGQAGLWVLQGGKLKQLDRQSGGDFLITPDSNAIVIAQGQGLAVVPLNPEQAAQPLDFLPQFGMVLSFARNGAAATMVKFNADFTRSLFLVSNQGEQKELLKTTGSILSAEFDPLQQNLYCLLTRLLPGADYNEEPYIARIELATGKLTTLLDLTGQRDLLLSLAPDGSALVFDQALGSHSLAAAPEAPPPGSAIAPGRSETLAASNLWLLPLENPAAGESAAIPEAIASGFHARWLP